MFDSTGDRDFRSRQQQFNLAVRHLPADYEIPLDQEWFYLEKAHPSVMNYADLETAIITRLSSITGLDVVPLPEHDNDWKTPYTGAKVTVAFNSSYFDPSDTSDIVTQPENIAMQLVIWSRKLRGTTGIYQVI